MVTTRSRANGSVTSDPDPAEDAAKVSGTEKSGKSDDTSLTADEKRQLRTVFISLVIDLLAFTVILPLLPSILDFYGTQEDSLYQQLKNSVHGFRELVGAPDTPRWNSVLFGGLIGSLFSLLQFIASPVIGAASDVYGRKPLLLLSMTGVALSYALWAISRNFGLFVLARIIGGMSKGNISLSTAMVADILPPQRRGKGMALVGVAFSIGFVFGPLIGAVFSKWARQQQGEFYVMPALFALALATLDVVYVAVAFKETLPEKKRAGSITSGWKNTSYLINPVSLFKFTSVTKLSQKEIQEVQRIGVVYFLYLFFYSGLEFTLTFLTHNRLQYDSMQQGKMFFFIGFVMTMVQGGYFRRAGAGKETKLAGQGMTVLIPSFLIMAFATSAVWIYVALAIFSFGFLIPSFLIMAFATSAVWIYVALAIFSFASATVVPSLTSLVSMYGGIDQKGTIMGVFRSLGALARALGPVFASTIYWSCGAATCYVTGGVLLVLPLVLLRNMAQPQLKKE